MQKTFLAFIATFLALVTLEARAQQPRFATSSELEQAFQALLADPANPELTMRYARLAMEAGNSEAAVAALERLILFNDSLPRARVELGVLYYRLGSYAQARDYLQRGLADPSLPADARASAQRYLEEIEDKLSPHALSGSLTVGFRYQTNANLGTSDGKVLQRGDVNRISDRFRKQDDGNFFGLLSLEHRYDLGLSDREAALESDFSLYGAKQFSIGRLDLMVADVSVGPRLQVAPAAMPGLTLRPYFRANVAVLEEAEYFHGLGFGAEARFDYSERLRLEAGYEFRALDYNNTRPRPFADDQSGIENTLSTGARYLITQNQRLEFRLSGRFNAAEKDHESFEEIATGITYQIGYRVPFWNLPQWVAAIYAGYAHTWYDGPDRSVVSRTRDDDEWRVGGYNVFNLDNDWSVLALLEYVENNSNIRNYEYNDLSFLLGLTRKF